MKTKHYYFVELTDVYGGEANYAWVTRFLVCANTEMGAINKVSREIGLSYRYDGIKYVSNSGCTCYFIEYCDDPEELVKKYDSTYNPLNRI